MILFRFQEDYFGLQFSECTELYNILRLQSCMMSLQYPGIKHEDFFSRCPSENS